MWDYIWPIALIVCANIVYNITTKQTPDHANAFLSLGLTYGVAMITTFIIFFCTKNGSITSEMSKINWTSFVLGIAIIGLETGYIFAFRNGWQVNMTSLVANILLAIALLFVGFLLYKEHITWVQLVGILMCIGGLILVCSNKIKG